jgi:alanyl-tRNA synthetase
MLSKQLREKFLSFFSKRGHQIVPSSSLLPTDRSVLFTTAGMQQFKEYFLGKESPYGKNVASCQKCFRTTDIEEVGDERHLTFLEMLGNFSFGGYFKKEAIEYAYEFIVKELKLKIDYVSVFEGDREVPRDEETKKIWNSLGISEVRYFGREDNFWGPTGDEGPCGPTTEIYINGVEIWNLVFNEYYQDQKGNLTLLKQKGVDTGMGLERLAMVVQNKKNVFETDLFSFLKGLSGPEKARRIIGDHLRGAVFLIGEGILPSNLERGYVLRRILRRAIIYGKLSGQEKNFLIPLSQKIIQLYKDSYPELSLRESEILTVIQNEEEKFERTLSQGLKQFEKLALGKKVSGENAFHLFDTYGFPLELTLELAKERNLEVDVEGFKKFYQLHQEISRAGAERKFGGHGLQEGATGQAVKLHTATHLLHAALRKVLGEHVRQMGSDITSERTRFDFSHPQKLTPQQIKEIEDLVNQKIKEDLEVKKEEMSYQEALKSGALAFFKERYPERVTVYSIGDFSREICGGPHVKRTSELGHFKIVKEESSGAGVRRIRAILK